MGSKYLKARSLEYMCCHFRDFIAVKLEGIISGSAELIPIDENTFELGAFVVDKRCNKEDKLLIAQHIIEFCRMYSDAAHAALISLTSNMGLQDIYIKSGGKLDETEKYNQRREKSPGVELFIL